jgi:hypothetical protein
MINAHNYNKAVVESISFMLSSDYSLSNLWRLKMRDGVDITLESILHSCAVVATVAAVVYGGAVGYAVYEAFANANVSCTANPNCKNIAVADRPQARAIHAPAPGSAPGR